MEYIPSLIRISFQTEPVTDRKHLYYHMRNISMLLLPTIEMEGVYFVGRGMPGMGFVSEQLGIPIECSGMHGIQL